MAEVKEVAAKTVAAAVDTMEAAAMLAQRTLTIIVTLTIVESCP